MAEVKVSALTALTGANVANGDELYIVDTGSPNVSKKITADELAQMPQLSSRYVAQTQDNQLFVAAGDMLNTDGTATVGSVGGMWHGWSLPDSATTRVGTTVKVPGHWTTFNVDLYWFKAGATTGDVVFYRTAETATGTSYSLGGGGAAGAIAAVAVPASTTNYAITSLATAQSAPGSTGLFSLRVGRNGSDAADTYTGAVVVLGVLLTKAT